MAEPFTLAVLGAVAATEGIKFLYGQAAEVLKRWRERDSGKEAEPIGVPQGPATDLLEGRLIPPAINFDVMDRLGDDIKELATALSPYAGGLDEVDLASPDLAAQVDALRKALEAVYGQRITFKGEDRPASGPAVFSSMELGAVAGDVAGVRARIVRGGRIESVILAKEVQPGGSLNGVVIDRLE